MIAKIILIGAQLIRIGREIVKHKQSKNQEYNGWLKFIAVVIVFILYYFAGIFNF